MRVDVEKVLLVGSVSEQEAFFHHVQRMGGLLEFIGQPVHVGAELTGWIDQLQSALKILRHQPARQQEMLPQHRTTEEIVHEVLNLEAERLTLEEQHRALAIEAARVEPFGEFIPKDIRWLESISRRRMRFFFVPSVTPASKRPEVEGLIPLGSAFDLDYFAGLLHEETVPAPYVEMEFVRPIQEVHDELQQNRTHYRKVLRQLEQAAAWIEELQDRCFQVIDRRDLRQALASVRPIMEGHLFASYAWMPRTQRAKVQQVCRRHQVLMKGVAIESHDQVPTDLENRGLNRIGEDLVNLYDTPSTNDRDPSGWVLWSFALFFAMIINDAGYGLLFVLGALGVSWKKGKLRGAMKRFQQLVLLLGFCSIIWGMGVHSFFGLNLLPGSALVEASPLEWMVEKKAEYHLTRHDAVYQEWVGRFPEVAQAKSGEQFLMAAVDRQHGEPKFKALETFSGNVLMEFALFVGVVHLSLGMVRHLDRNMAGLGWILCMWGGFLFAPSFLKATSFFQYVVGIPPAIAERYGLEVMLVGVGLACILAVVQRGWLGLTEITKGISLLSDVLSYLRLYALGLAGAIIASVANDLGSAVGLFAGTLIILVGHMVNILMTVMAGVIHGLRLNFLEWYNTCFEGGGRLFRPLRLLSRFSE
ncbi:MAG: V-type ATPase 116kDa subunit family protein [Chlamydiia bacterium]